MRLSLLGFFRTKKLEPADKNEDEKTGPIFDPQYIFTNCGAGNGAIFWDRFSNRFLVFFLAIRFAFYHFSAPPRWVPFGLGPTTWRGAPRRTAAASWR